jgi:hypothetical protein
MYSVIQSNSFNRFNLFIIYLFIHSFIHSSTRTYIFVYFEKFKFAEDETGLSVALQLCMPSQFSDGTEAKNGRRHFFIVTELLTATGRSRDKYN